jgi:hypothetical protein
MRRFRLLALIAAIAFAVPIARTQHHFLRNVVEEFALHAKRDAHVGERVSLPDAIFQQVSSTAVKSAISCHETHRHALDAYRLPPSAKGEQAFAILGRGFCYCNVEGNCKMWVFTFKDGKFDKALEIQDAQTFGYVSSKSAFPLLIVWTRLEPTEFGARVFHFYAGKYDEAGAWVERYEYADPRSDSDEAYIHELPEIESRFPPGFAVPN